MGFATATEKSLGSVQQNTCARLKQTCANCSFVNITSITLKNIQYVSNVQMTKSIVDFNYTFCNTSTMGEYTYVTYGNPDGTTTCNTCSEPVTFQVTADGNPYQSFPYQIILLMLGFIFVFIGLFYKANLITYLGATITLVMGILTLYPGYNYINYSNLTGQLLGISSIGAGFYYLLHDFLEKNDGDDNE